MRAERARSDIRAHPVLVTAAVGFIGWLVLAVAALAVGVVVTHFVVGHLLGAGDLEVARWLAHRRTNTWNTISLVGSHVADTVTVFVVVAIALIVLGARRAWPQFALLAVAMAAEGGTYLVATYFVSRDRPAVPRLEDLIFTDSFPSGHTAAAVALYGSLCITVWSLTTARVWRSLSILLAVVAPIVVGVSRVYRGMHNPTDVIAGLLMGAGCIAVAYIAVTAGLTAAHARQELDRGDDRPPDLRLVHGIAP